MAIDKYVTTILPFFCRAKQFQRGFLLIELLAAFSLLSGVVVLFAACQWRHTQQLYDARMRLTAVSHAREHLDQAIVNPDLRNTRIKKNGYTIISATYPLEVEKHFVVSNISAQTDESVSCLEIKVAWLDASDVLRSVRFVSSVIT